MTDSGGADVVMEAVGNEAALSSAFMIRPKGPVSVVGVFVEPAADLFVGQAGFGEFTLSHKEGVRQ